MFVSTCRTGPAQMPIQQMRRCKQDSARSMEDDFKDSFSCNVGYGDKRNCHNDDEKRSPASVVPDTPDDAANCERNRSDNDQFRGFAREEPQPQQRQNRYQKRHCHTMDRTCARQNRADVIHHFMTDVVPEIFHLSSFWLGPGTSRQDRINGARLRRVLPLFLKTIIDRDIPRFFRTSAAAIRSCCRRRRASPGRGDISRTSPRHRCRPGRIAGRSGVRVRLPRSAWL